MENNNEITNSKKKKAAAQEMSISDVIEVFIPKLWIIALVAILVAALLGVYSAKFQDDTYTSGTSMMVVKDKETGETSSSDITIAQKVVSVYGYIIRSQSFTERLIAESEELTALGLTPGEVRGTLQVTQYEESEIFVVNSTHTNKDVAFAIANAIYEKADAILPDMVPYTISMKTIDPPTLAGAPNSKNVLRNTVLGFAAGLVVSALFVWVTFSIDVIIHDRKKLEETLDIPILGVIPRYEALQSEKGEEGYGNA